MAVIIIAGLAYLDIRLSVVAFIVVGGAYALVFGVLKIKLGTEGRNLSVFSRRKIKLLHESLGGIKEVRLLGKEGVYEYELNAANESGAVSAAFIGLAADLPKFIIETTAFCALMLLSVYLLRTYGASTSVISTIGLYAMAGYKLLPAAQQIYKSVSQVKSNGVGLKHFIDDVFEGRAHRRAGEIVAPVVPLGRSGSRRERFLFVPGRRNAGAARRFAQDQGEHDRVIRRQVGCRQEHDGRDHPRDADADLGPPENRRGRRHDRQHSWLATPSRLRTAEHFHHRRHDPGQHRVRRSGGDGRPRAREEGRGHGEHRRVRRQSSRGICVPRGRTGRAAERRPASAHRDRAGALCTTRTYSCSTKPRLRSIPSRSGTSCRRSARCARPRLS